MSKNTSVRIRACGNVTAYAPSTAAIAPLAPITGEMLLGAIAQWVAVAASPPNK